MKNSNDYLICKASFDDIDKMLLLEDELDTKILTQNNMLEDMQNDHFVYFILKSNTNNIIGYIAISYVLDTMDILSIVIKKDYQKQGLGTYLLEYIINFAKENNISNILLEVRKSNFAAIKLYEKFNFKKISIRKNYYNFPLEDALIYKLDII